MERVVHGGPGHRQSRLSPGLGDLIKDFFDSYSKNREEPLRVSLSKGVESF